MLPIVSMRTSVVFPAVFATLWVLCFGSASMAQNSIRWTDDFEAAVRHATTNNMPLMLHFYGDNCPPCRLLEKKAFLDRELITKINQNVVAVRINGEKQRELRTRYQVNRWPTDVYLLPNGEEIHRTVSPQDPAVYGQLIDRVALRHRDWSVEQNALQAANERKVQNRTSAQVASAAPPGSLLGNNSYQGSNYSGPVTHPVSTSGAAAQRTQPASNQRVISNPYASNDPSNPNNNGLSAEVAPTSTPAIVSAPYQNSPAQHASVPSSQRDPNASLASLPPASSLNNPSYAPGSGYGAIDNRMVNPASIPKVPNPSVPAYNASDANYLPSAQPSLRPASTTSNEPSSDETALPPNSPSALTNPGRNASSTPAMSASTPVYAETIGLEGYCPVTLFKGVQSGATDSWVDGSSEFAVRHRGRIYFCRDEAARREFLQSPDRYAPCLSCFDLIHFVKSGKLLDGKCEFGCFQSGTGRVFLFATQENCDEFKRSEAYYSKLVEDTSGRVATQPHTNPIR